MKGQEFIDLKNRIKENFTDSDWRELAVLVDAERLITADDRLLRSLRFGDDDYEGCILKVLRRVFDADEANVEIVLNFLEERCGPEGECISSVEPAGRTVVFSPSVFRLPDVEVDTSLVSVMMPFDAEFAPVYEAIAEAASAADYRCLRADDIWDDSTVIQDIFALIFESNVVVCDFSTKNPNVFYEAGIAHTLGKHVVPITQHESDIPFDVRHHRYIKYLSNAEGLSALRQKLSSRLATLR
ncbi:hypothetical protein MalM25_05160 [Planctomycetes bacterium MalM25]|nr:hypothetical protein MalM25_05160 [Planctomycetes bacterium MalM25]